MMGLSSNFGNMFSYIGAVLFLPFLPMLPIQILLNNFIYDFSQITIPVDNVDPDLIKYPRRWDMVFIRKFMMTFGLLLLVFHLNQASFQTGWFIESLATQTLVIHIIRTKKIPFIQSNAHPFLLLSSIVAVCLGWIIPFTPLGQYFGMTPLPLPVLISILGLAALYLIVVEVAKKIFYKFHPVL